MSKLVTAEKAYASPHRRAPLGGRQSHPAEWAVIAHWPGTVEFFLPLGVCPIEGLIRARVDWGRWIVSCPFCPSGQVVSPEDRRFFCVGCLNVVVGGDWLPVAWPEEWAEIEELLLRRPHPGTRNWSPGESLEDLAAENAAHGVGA